MKILKTLLYTIIIINSVAYSRDYVIDASANLADSIQINQGSKWALDGGVFKDFKSEIYIKNNGTYSLLILENNGELTSHQITIENGINGNQSFVNTLHIDNKAPDVTFSWDNVSYQGEQVIVGPNSQLKWQVNDEASNTNIFINDDLIQTNGNSIQMKQNMKQIVIKTEDPYLNKSETVIPFKTHFIPPSISWKLKAPSIQHNNQWYSHKSAVLDIQYNSSLDYKVNGKPISQDMPQLRIFNNSNLTATDAIGNSVTEKITWSENNLAPQLSVTTLESEFINPKKLKVKVGQKIYIQAIDEIFGVVDSVYYTSNRKWMPIPEAFVFVDTGLYRLKLKSSNNLGNDLISEIVFKIIK